MSKKKSLGHNPLAYSTRRHASFDFITPSDPEETDQELGNEESEKPRVNKTTASYYLEESVIESIKAIADERETSYSSIVNVILKSAIKKLKNK